MKLSKKLLKALVGQVNMEFASGYLYRSMSHDMKNLALNGYAKWLDKQYEEEREHALKLIDYIEDRDGTVDFLPIEGVKKHYDNPLDVAKDSLAHEEAVSASIRSLVKLAREEGDLETEIFLHSETGDVERYNLFHIVLVLSRMQQYVAWTNVAFSGG